MGGILSVGAFISPTATLAINASYFGFYQLYFFSEHLAKITGVDSLDRMRFQPIFHVHAMAAVGAFSFLGVRNLMGMKK